MSGPADQGCQRATASPNHVRLEKHVSKFRAKGVSLGTTAAPKNIATQLVRSRGARCLVECNSVFIECNVCIEYKTELALWRTSHSVAAPGFSASTPAWGGLLQCQPIRV